MKKSAASCLLVLALSTIYVHALPAPPAEDSDAPVEVEIVKSEEVPIRKKSIDTLEDSEKRLNAIKEETKDSTADLKNIQEENRGARMLGVVQSVLQSILQPQPIVDTISEEDKYGNNGDTLGALGRGIVGGSEALSNFVNLAIEYPTNLFKSLAHRATEALNHLGSRLVGL
ncbi:uncharacterized protein LOC124162494 [Ischnura elegans]|uniref:uncharacterized protein LOC124162494 n=1 Tax=Ischnura elegans TaxID=197161 RepID=UPI001ED88DD6|nr:uncharacterized protein LOC124162494 [Ischnura elegans]